MKTFVIAEAGVNHNGDEALALRLVETAAACGADAVKFQTFSAEKLVRRGAGKAEYQKRETGDGDQYDMLKALEMSETLHLRLLARCRELGIEFMSTPFDLEAAEFLLSLGMKRIKIPSGELTNIPFIRELARRNCPLILSTGMATLGEVVAAISAIGEARLSVGLAWPVPEMLTVLHCTSNYPTPPEDVNLRAMVEMGSQIGFPVGYSDHTKGIEISIAAAALGAVVIEKHFTLDRNLPGPDHKASLEPAELAAMVSAIRNVTVSLGDGIKAPRPAEIETRSVARRSVTIVRPVQCGDRISPEDVALLRPGNGISPIDIERVIGLAAVRDLSAGTTLMWSDIA